MEPKVSVIVPVHNAGVYFEKCLHALTNQTLHELEIILVLDCPSDGSDKVAEAYAANDDRIKLVYNKTNLHIGFSRNVGLQQVTGKYVAFMDHDDYCEPDMYERLYEEAIKGDLDVVRCNYTFDYILNPAQRRFVKYNYPCELETSTRVGAIKKILHRDYATQLWNYLFRADLIKLNRIDFVDTRNCNTEDGIFILEALFCAVKVNSIASYLYYHVEHERNSAKSYGYYGVQPTICYLQHVGSKINKHHVGDLFYADYLAGLGYNFYSLFRKALINKDYDRAFQTIASIRGSDFYTTINELFLMKNFFLWFRIKPAVVAFLLIVKSAPGWWLRKRQKHP